MPDGMRNEEMARELMEARRELIVGVRDYADRQCRLTRSGNLQFPIQDGIPSHDEDGLLPPGIYTTNWAEFSTRFGYTERRQRQMYGLLAAMHLVKKAGGLAAIVGGSFITAKQDPGDIDCCWEPQGLDKTRCFRHQDTTI